MTNQMRRYFNTIGKNYCCTGMNTEAMVLENKDFCDKDQWQCMYTWEFFVYIFFGIRKTPTQTIATNQTFPWWVPPGKFPLGIFPPMFLNIPARACNFFFHYCYRYHWYYLKDCFVILCFKSAEVFTFVKTKC